MNPPVQPPQKEQHKKDFWTSSQHYAGCYGAALFWLLSMLNILSHDWFASAFMGYVAGILYYSTVKMLPVKYQRMLGVQPKSEPVLLDTPLNTLATNEPTLSKDVSPEPTPTVPPFTQSVSISPAEQLMAEFDALYMRAKPKLPLLAQEKFQDIHDLLALMVHKIQRTQHVSSQLDMLNIQRVINHYIIPLIENYEDLPSFLLDRKKDNALSPNEMLMNQLNLIHDEVLKITEHVFHNNLEALSIHGDFLKQKLTPHEFFKVEASEH